jgi:diguanylate cyclase (GGDEF)-like protein/PAS domain S-box-containing protein
LNTFDKKSSLESARVKHLFSASKIALITGILLASILAFMQRDVIAISVVIVWFSLFAIVTLVRAVHVFDYHHSQSNDLASTRVRLLQFRIGVLISGVMWGSTGILMFPHNDQQHQMFLIFMLAGLTAGGMVSFSADLKSSIFYAVTVLVPLMISLFIGNESTSLAMAIAVLLYLGFMIMNSRQVCSKVLENIELSLDAVEKEKMVRAHADNLQLNNHILSKINQHTALPSMLKELVLHIEARHPGMICSILLVDNDGKTLRSVASPSLPDFYNQVIDGLQIGDNVGSCGTAAFRGERVIVEDIQQHPYWVAYRDLANKADVQSCWSQPIKNNVGKVLGTLAIYHRQKSQPSDSELSLIANYANLAQLTIESSRAQNDLRISAIAFECQDGMVVTDSKGTILRANRTFTKITGYSEKEVIGQTFGMQASGRHDVNVYAEMWEDIKDADVWEGELRNIRKNGEDYPEQLTVSKVKDLSGITTNFVASISDITLSKAVAEEIQSLAFYDPLTKLPNRRLLHNRLEHAMATRRRSGKDVALLYLDLDNFKTLNDSLGHDVGDRLLQQVAERLTNCVREGDTVARLGGDEYLVMLENLSERSIEAASQAKVIAEKILTVLNQPYQFATNLYHGSASIGVALLSDNVISRDDLLKHADIAMYQAKKMGRNAVRFYDPEMQDAIHNRIELERELRLAIEKQQFQLYYQIQVDDLGNTLGAEALIRWIHPERGLISPLNFIPLAEDSGLILPIGQWVMESACAQLKLWQLDKLTCDLVVSINVSAKQFHYVDFVEQVQNTINQYAINPTLLKFELTESMLVESIEETIIKMDALKKIGIQFSLDDFGTGYSSLQYLKRLPLNQLKIDKSFVRDIVVDNSDKAIVRTIIAMAQGMGLEVIAEGVETEEQQLRLLNKGCKKFQGYLFGRPLPIDEFEVALRQKKTHFNNLVNIVRHLSVVT